MDGGEQPAAHEERRLPFSFSGTGKDYFLICLRTFLLAIVTLGVYDAWGTVERRRYLLGHTKLDGHGFDYHAKPWVILLARLIVVAAIVDINIFSRIWPVEVALGTALVLAVLLPWVINSAWRFTLRNTSYRNVRFDFQGTYLQTFLRFLIVPLVLILSLGLAWPWVKKVQCTYIGNSMRFGSAPFSMSIRIGALYTVFLTVCAITILMVLVLSVVFAVVAGGESIDIVVHGEFQRQNTLVIAIVTVAYLVVFPIVWIMQFAIQAALRNAVINGALLDGKHSFESTLRPWRYGVFSVGSYLAAALTLGLLAPWAILRIRRYELDHMVMVAQGGLDTFSGQNLDAGDAVGAEIGVMEGLAGGAF